MVLLLGQKKNMGRAIAPTTPFGSTALLEPSTDDVHYFLHVFFVFVHSFAINKRICFTDFQLHVLLLYFAANSKKKQLRNIVTHLKQCSRSFV